MSVSPVFRTFRYFCWIVLALSLPTFSDWLPDRAKGVGETRRLPAGHLEGWKLPQGGRADPEGLTVPAVSLERAEAEQMVKLSGPVLTGAGIVDATGTVATIGAGSEESRISNSVENRSSPRDAYPGTTDGLSERDEPAQWWPVESALELHSDLESELLRLQQGYELAFHNLFADLSLNFVRFLDNPLDNPFEEALRKQSPEGVVKETNPKPADRESPPQDGAPGSGGVPPEVLRSPDAPKVEKENEPSDFLVVTDLKDSVQKTRVFQADSNDKDHFVLENSVELSLLLITRRNSALFPENEQVSTGDFNGDGVMDYVVARIDQFGTTVEMHAGNRTEAYRLEAEGFIYRRYVRSFAVVDFNDDGQVNVVVLFRGSSHLYIYEFSNQQLKYLRELVPAFEPGLVIAARPQELLGGQRLYVFDETLQRSFSVASSQFNTVFSVRANAFSIPVRTMKLRVGEGGLRGSEITVVEYGQSVVLAERDTDTVTLLASLNDKPRLPMAIFGDYLGNQSRQLLVLP